MFDLDRLGFLDMDIEAPTPEGDIVGLIPERRIARQSIARGIEQKRIKAMKQKREKRTNERWAGIDDLLGTMSDKVLAKRVGRSSSTIHARRVKLGIPAYGRQFELDWDRFDPQLGTMPDFKLAKLVGCTPGTIEKRRREFEIPKFKERGRKNEA